MGNRLDVYLYRQAIEQASRRWRGGRRDDSARTRRKFLISTQVLDILFPIVFGRLLLVAMLEERNVRLARSITEAADRSRGNVVAILGALHVNGVARLLKDPSGYGEGKAGTWWTDDMIEAKPE